MSINTHSWFSVFIVLLDIPNNLIFCPKSQLDAEIEKYLEFTISYSELHEQPYWVAYELTAEEVKIQRSRKDYFKADINISTSVMSR